MPIQKRLATQVSLTVIRQQRPSEDVETSALTNADDVAASLEPFLIQGLPEGASLPDLALFQVILGTIVGRHADAMEAADEANFAALSRLNHLRLVRDSLIGIVLPKLLDFRDTFDVTYGPNTCQRILGLGIGIPRDALTVRRLTDRVVSRLTAPDFELPPQRSEGVKVDPVTWVAEVSPSLGGLRTTMTSVSEAKRLADRTLEAKNAAVETYNNSYSWCTSLLETFYRMGGREHLADRLRPTIPRSRSRTTEVNPSDGDTNVDPTGDGTDDGRGADDGADGSADGGSNGGGADGSGSNGGGSNRGGADDGEAAPSAGPPSSGQPPDPPSVP